MVPALSLIAGIAVSCALCAFLVAPPPLPRGAGAEPYIGLSDPRNSRTAAFLSEARPHPAESAAGGQMREAVLADLRDSGYADAAIEVKAHFQANESIRGKSWGTRAARVANIELRLRGSARKSGTLVVICHYDSIAGGPGAGDGGFGVLACLGALKAMRGQTAFERDLLFIFADGEEDGLVGSSAAVAKDKAADGALFVVNMEGLERGLVLPMEMSRPNALALDAFGSAFPRAYVSGLLLDIFAILPNFATDLNEFEEAGARGLTLAPVQDFLNYHQAGDRLETLDDRSLAQASRGLVSMLRYLDSRATPDGGKGERAVQSLLPGLTISYPAALTPWIAAFLWAVYLALFVLAALRGRDRVLPSLASAALAALILALSLGIGFLVNGALGNPSSPMAFLSASARVKARISSLADLSLALAYAAPFLASLAGCLALRKVKALRGGGPGALALLLGISTALSAFLYRSAPSLFIPAAAALCAFGISALAKPTIAIRSICAFLLGSSIALTAAPLGILLGRPIVAFNMGFVPGFFASILVLLAFPFIGQVRMEAEGPGKA
jgi:hypothetical protein